MQARPPVRACLWTALRPTSHCLDKGHEAVPDSKGPQVKQTGGENTTEWLEGVRLPGLCDFSCRLCTWLDDGVGPARDSARHSQRSPRLHFTIGSGIVQETKAASSLAVCSTASSSHTTVLSGQRPSRMQRLPLPCPQYTGKRWNLTLGPPSRVSADSLAATRSPAAKPESALNPALPGPLGSSSSKQCTCCQLPYLVAVPSSGSCSGLGLSPESGQGSDVQALSAA